MEHEQTRQEIAFEAARLLQARRASNYSVARWTAARALTRCYLPSSCLPTDMEIRIQLQRLMGSETAFPDEPSIERSQSNDDLPDSRFAHYLALLLPLDRVRQSMDTHPEGDVLYHCLQVFELTCDAQPWDEELLTAALMHDVGKGIDPRDSHQAGLRALNGYVTERTLWLIENLPSAHRIFEGTLGVRARRRLAIAADWAELDLLAASDREGRVPGRRVRSAEDAVEFLRQLSSG